MLKRFILLFAILWSVDAVCQDVSSQNEQKRRLEEEIAYIDNQLKAVLNQEKASLQQMTLLQQKINNRKALVNQADREIRNLNNSIAEQNRQISRLQSELDTLQSYYSEMIYNTYKNRDTKVWFMYLLASENIGQGYRRFSYLKRLSETVSDQAEAIKGMRSKLEAEKEELTRLRDVAKETKADREKEYTALLADQKRSKTVLNTLNRNKTKYTTEINKKRKEVERLNKEIERILKEAVNGQKSETVDYTLASEFQQNKGKLPWPVQGIVTEKFGVQSHPVYKNIQMPTNNGITITTTKSAEVKCVFNGTIKQVLIMPGYNQCVLVQHGTYFTFYCKLAKVNVKAGQKVATGDILGTLEVSENASTLHFQIWNGTDKQDPENWLR
ncbi:MAG: peptidoglycan DD-metalloendopeptidase family protein [Bacteroidales bacterium]|nr:peptidoglycan DD-metalloendopeptidase family protein [Bacteroidales bacterium]